MSMLKESIKIALEERPTRPELGDEISIHLSKVVFTSLFDLGTAGEGFLYHAGRHLGEALVEMGEVGGADIEEVLEALIRVLTKLRLGKFTLLKVENDAATLQVDECYFCSGLPVVQRRVCFYDVGMLSGVLTTALEAEFEVKETKCNCMGDKVCEYEVRRI